MFFGVFHLMFSCSVVANVRICGCVGSYKLPLGQYTCIGQVVACSFQQKYDFSKVPFQAYWHTPHTCSLVILVPGSNWALAPIDHLSVGVVQQRNAMWEASAVTCTSQGCWVRYTHSGNYEARGASGDYEARGASGDYEARGASGGKYKARMVIFRVLAAVNRFPWISWKEESR